VEETKYIGGGVMGPGRGGGPWLRRESGQKEYEGLCITRAGHCFSSWILSNPNQARASPLDSLVSVRGGPHGLDPFSHFKTLMKNNIKLQVIYWRENRIRTLTGKMQSHDILFYEFPIITKESACIDSN
jgi:hypothetical protein